MTSFMASAPAPTAPQQTAEATIGNDGWYPDIDLAKMRESTRLDGTVTDTRLLDAIVAAVISVNRELQSWQIDQKANGYDTLEDVPAPTINNISTLVALYLRAIYSTAKADLMERYRDFDTTSEGNKKADLMVSPIDEQRRNAQWAIADMQGRPHVTVELI